MPVCWLPYRVSDVQFAGPGPGPGPVALLDGRVALGHEDGGEPVDDGGLREGRQQLATEQGRQGLRGSRHRPLSAGLRDCGRL